MYNEKTLEEWANYLPADTKEKYLVNLRKDELPLQDTTCSTLADALGLAFRWDKTPEGKGFWKKVCDEASSKLTR